MEKRGISIIIILIIFNIGVKKRGLKNYSPLFGLGFAEPVGEASLFPKIVFIGVYKT